MMLGQVTIGANRMTSVSSDVFVCFQQCDRYIIPQSKSSKCSKLTDPLTETCIFCRMRYYIGYSRTLQGLKEVVAGVGQ